MTELMRRRKALMMQAKATSILPAEYQAVEWIGSSGTQYIDTGVKYYKHTIYLDAEITKEQVKYLIGVGVLGQMANKAFYIGIGTTTYGLQARANNIGETRAWHDGSYDSQRFQMLCNDGDGNVVYNGTTYSSSQLDTNEANTIPLFLFGQNFGGSLKGGSTSKCYRCTIWDKTTGDMIADFVPCYRKSDDVIGMFDLVSETFKTNLGSGTFTKGDDVK